MNSERMERKKGEDDKVQTISFPILVFLFLQNFL